MKYKYSASLVANGWSILYTLPLKLQAQNIREVDKIQFEFSLTDCQKGWQKLHATALNYIQIFFRISTKTHASCLGWL